MSGERFTGFPGVGRATAIPNLFFTTVLPDLQSPGALLAFLLVSQVVQEQRTEARFATADQVWMLPGARKTFKHLGGGREGLERGLEECREAGALLGVRLNGPAGTEWLYFVNNPASRKAIARARAGELKLKPETVVTPIETEERPGIFRLYEEQVGTITPLVGDRLVDAEETYPLEWIEEAFREAAELNIRNWRYIERILQRWAEEGRANEKAGPDSREEPQLRFFGESPGPVAHYR
ncbi:MAG: hypothetical protein C0506_02205 [Anaerolinea sp.]|nr:hypothetical protein [Anaerolinea sp.]